MYRLILLTFLLLPFSSQAASFDCSKAKSLVEITICQDPALSKMDDELAPIYLRAKASAVDKEAFQAATKSAWRQREDNCRTKECIANWYKQRKTFLLAASQRPSNRAIKINNGPNQIDFTGEGVPDLVVSGRRENFNAHSFELVSFYTTKNLDPSDKKQWSIVPLFSGDKEEFQVIVRGGADCLTNDFRLLQGKSNMPATLVLASREVKNGYFQSETVTFRYYSLTANSDVDIGAPAYWFKLTRSSKSQTQFCDVGDALQKELALGPK